MNEEINDKNYQEKRIIEQLAKWYQYGRDHRESFDF